MDVILERNSAGEATAGYLRNPYAAGGIGGIINAQQGIAPETYYSYDGLGSVANLSDTSGANIQSYSYDAFGNSLTSSNSTSNTHQFLTKETDFSGFVYFGARYYDPSIGRFITQDPSGMSDGPNTYLYCLNNPVDFFDPDGLDPYYINNKFSSSTPTNRRISHSFGAITDKDPVSGKEKVTKTFSWVDTNRGLWEDPYKPQNIKGAQEAIDKGIGVKRYGGEDLDKYVEMQFEKRKNEVGGYNLAVNNCKEKAASLLKDAIKQQTKEKRKKCKY